MSEKRGSVEQTASGRWRLRMRLAGVGRTTIDTYDTEAEAEAARLDAARILADEAPDEGVTLGEFGDTVLTARDVGRKVRDPRTERSRWDNHVAGDPIARIGVRNLRDRHVEDWLERLEAKGLARATRLACLNVLRVVLRAARKKRLAKANPCADVRLERDARTEDPWTYATPDEQGRLVAAAPKPLDALVEFAIGSGLRAGELAALRLSDVHLDGPDPHVVVRYGAAPAEPTKGKKIRHVPLFGRSLAAMRRWLDALPSFCPRNPLGLAFPGARGAFRDEDHVLNWPAWKAILEGAGIDRRFRWHDLRHTCAASLVSGWWGRCWSIVEVRDLLGHRSVTTTERYAHLADTALKRAARETALPVQAGPRGRRAESGDQRENAGGGRRRGEAVRCDLVGRGERVDSSRLFGGVGPDWTGLLEAVAAGDARRARTLGVALARAVLGSDAAHAVSLAHAVLAGGPHATARAVELAELVARIEGRPARAVGGES